MVGNSFIILTLGVIQKRIALTYHLRQWMFVFDGIIGIPIGLWGYFAIPDLPHNTRAFYWTAADKEYTLSRVEQLGRPPTPKLTLRALWGVFTNWRLWLFIL